MQPPPRVKGHGRMASSDERRRIAITRRSTKGPLDADFDDPLASPAAANQAGPAPLSPNPFSHPHFQQQQHLQQPITPTRQSQLSPAPSTPASVLESTDKDFGFLLHANNFHPLPPHTTPHPFLSASHQPPPSASLRDLLDGGHYRSAAIAAAKALVTNTTPADHARIFSLFYVRLACLTLLNQHALAAAEAKLLGDLASAFYRNPLTGSHIVPWELRVLSVRLMGLGYGDWRRGVMGYYELAREARIEAIKSHDPNSKQIWKGRLRELAIRVANALIEMGECEGAARHLAGLVRADSGTDEAIAAEEKADSASLSPESARLKSMEALTWIKVGDIDAAKRCVAASPSPAPHTPSAGDAPPPADPLNALVAMAEADYPTALTIWDMLAAESPDDPMVTQNRAVCLLYVGRIADARALLEDLIDHGENSSYAFHALTFNLSTIYELCTERSRERKLELVDKVSALEPSAMGWERQAGDFKL
ncbi:tetratricopeptide repeat protein 15 [Diplodia corticola]|uniref:Tetratricopeptide repeat protein 15 n=1 Tax=Diplodia corticola TaxID=236234 RepID=A0A1J9QWS2_9PEZI|nr:tetratricopeptide repeat protein 15 [Diplodia corticola]OJD32442.1 tetratricopeptide repeat protein 15 [Diplodia corticola]